MANRAALQKQFDFLATASNCTIETGSVSFVNFFKHLKNKLLGKESL